MSSLTFYTVSSQELDGILDVSIKAALTLA